MQEQFDVIIEKLVYGGSGLARHESGRSVFVQGVLPGERVRVSTLRRRKGFIEAAPVEVLSPSPDRVAPPCTGEEECTGATWSYIAYPAQLRYKEEIIKDVLKRIGGLEPEQLLPIIPSPKTEHYRLRTQFNVRWEEGRPKIGFFRPGTYFLVEVERNILLHPLIDKALGAMRSLSSLLPRAAKEIHINVSPVGEAVLLIFGETGIRPNLEALFEGLRTAVPEVVGIAAYADKKKVCSLGRNFLYLELDGMEFRVTEGNFYQVNWEQNGNMVKTVLEFADLSEGGVALDLYCGIGNFALPLAKRAKAVIGIESGYSAVEDARANAAHNRLENTEFIADDLQKGLKSLLQRRLKADVVVLDPPRAGATLKTLERILAFVPRKIIYVSCNPSTLARDLKYFALFGFRLKRLRPIDIFPHTFHIECVAEMERE